MNITHSILCIFKPMCEKSMKLGSKKACKFILIIVMPDINLLGQFSLGSCQDNLKNTNGRDLLHKQKSMGLQDSVQGQHILRKKIENQKSRVTYKICHSEFERVIVSVQPSAFSSQLKNNKKIFLNHETNLFQSTKFSFLL